MLKWKYLQNQDTWLCHHALSSSLNALSLSSLISKMETVGALSQGCMRVESFVGSA